MTVLDDSPRSTYAPRLQRRHEIVTTGGMDGVLCVADADDLPSTDLVRTSNWGLVRLRRGRGC